VTKSLHARLLSGRLEASVPMRRVAGGANGGPHYHRHPWPRASSSVPSATRTIP
jgi:hypothetical protein